MDNNDDDDDDNDNDGDSDEIKTQSGCAYFSVIIERMTTVTKIPTSTTKKKRNDTIA